MSILSSEDEQHPIRFEIFFLKVEENVKCSHVLQRPLSFHASSVMCVKDRMLPHSRLLT